MKIRSPLFSQVIATCLILMSGTSPLGAAGADQVRAAIDLAAEHLVRMQQQNGLFQYDVNLRTGKATGQNNIVRQVGTVFSLAEYLGLTRSDTVRRPIRNVLTALRKRSVVFRKRNQWIIADRRNLAKARAGATALALLTETFYYRATGDGRFEMARLGWMRGLLALRNRGRGFRKTPYSRRESPYFNGEIWLALAHYYETFRDPAVGKILPGIDAYMMKVYDANPHVGFYHWGAMAAAVRYRTTRDLRLLKFLERQTANYLQTLRPKVAATKNTCYALEGLLTASDVLKRSWPSAPVMPVLTDRLNAEIPKNLAFQFLEDPAENRSPGRTGRKPVDLSQYRGLFFARDKRDYGRIDYTQHCLSAFVKLHSTLTGREVR